MIYAPVGFETYSGRLLGSIESIPLATTNKRKMPEIKFMAFSFYDRKRLAVAAGNQPARDKQDALIFYK
jgi:hypothetical protein